MDSPLTRYLDLSPLPAERLDEEGYEWQLAAAQRSLGADPAPSLDAVIHGVRVRLHTNNVHWRRFWSANWFGPDQWATLTGGLPPTSPQVQVYATAPDAQTLPWASYNLEQSTAFLTGDTPYGQLRALVLGVVARFLAEEEAVHFLPASCFEKEGRGTLLLSSFNPDLEPTIWNLMEEPEVHLVAFDGVFVRYGLVRMVDGVTLLPTLVIDEKGITIPGYRLFPWLDAYGFWEPRADAFCLTLDGEEVYCFARDLDLGRDPEAFAYPAGKGWYVPTQIVTAQPGLVGALWDGGLENVPPLAQDALDCFGDWARKTALTMRIGETPSARSSLAEEGRQAVVEALCCLRAAPLGRAMISPEQLWPGRAGGHPLRPLQVERVVQLDAGAPIRLGPTALSEHFARPGVNPYMLDGDDIASTLTTMLGRATAQED